MEKEMLLEKVIIIVHSDLDPWAALSSGFNDNKEFVVEMTYDRMESDDYTPRLNFDKRIIIDQKGVDRLINNLRTRLTKLPEAMAEKFGHDGESWSVSEVFDTFDEILNYMSFLKIRYKLEKEYK